MSDPRPPEQERLWAILRAAQPPTGASARVREQIEATLDRESLRPPHRRALAILASVGLAAALLAIVIGLDRDETDSPETAGVSDGSHASEARVLSASAATLGGKPLATGQAIPSGPEPSGPVRIAETGRLRVALAKAEVDVAGPANIELSRRGIEIQSGRVEIQGSTWVAGPGCEAEVTGRAEVAVSDKQVQITVFAGSVAAAPKQVTCKLIDLTPAREDSSPPARESSATSTDNEKGPLEAASPASPDTANNATGDGTAQKTIGDGTATGTTSNGSAAGTTGNGSAAGMTGNGTAASTREGTSLETTGNGTAARTRESASLETTRNGTAAKTTGEDGVGKATREGTAATGADRSRRAIRPGRGDAATSLLARQVEAYRAADRLRDSEPAAALAAFEALQAAWPRSALRHEIDLAIIDLLIRLGRVESARGRAREFLANHPDSPRRDHVSRIATQK